MSKAELILSLHFAGVCPPSAIFAVCCSSRHTLECAQLRFMSPTHLLQNMRGMHTYTLVFAHVNMDLYTYNLYHLA